MIEHSFSLLNKDFQAESLCLQQIFVTLQTELALALSKTSLKN